VSFERSADIGILPATVVTAGPGSAFQPAKPARSDTNRPSILTARESLAAFDGEPSWLTAWLLARIFPIIPHIPHDRAFVSEAASGRRMTLISPELRASAPLYARSLSSSDGIVTRGATLQNEDS
jgi:hypothetical protein